jgi:sporulation integral membrane protein YtvI
MPVSPIKKIVALAAAAVGLWLGVKYLLPVALPFLLGAGVAFVAEPLVGRLARRLPRGISAGIGVTATLVGVAAVATLVGAVAVKELGRLAAALPDLESTARQGMTVAQDFAVNLADRAPESMRPALRRSVLEFFDDGAGMMQQLTRHIPGVVGTTIGWVGNGVLWLGTGLLAAFLISSRLPKLKKELQARLPKSWYEKYQPALHRVRASLGGWLKAQLKLCAVTWGIVTAGFLLLGISYAPAWAVLVAVVDAVPILGTGTVLVPWALVCILQGESLRAIGLLCTYGVAVTVRTVLEPRLVGRHLGLDPLATLAALYVGYRFWGFLGLVTAPILASAAKSLVES